MHLLIPLAMYVVPTRNTSFFMMEGHMVLRQGCQEKRRNTYAGLMKTSCRRNRITTEWW